MHSRRGQPSLSFQTDVDPAAPTQTVALQAAAGEAVIKGRHCVQASETSVLTVPGKQYVTVGSRLTFQVGAASGAGTVMRSAHALPSGARSTGLFECSPGAPDNERVTFMAIDITQSSTTADVAIQTGDGAPVVESLQNAARDRQKPYAPVARWRRSKAEGYLRPPVRMCGSMDSPFQ